MRVILLNADTTFHQLIDWQKAYSLHRRNKAEPVKLSEKIIKNFEGTVEWVIPKIMRLFDYVSLHKRKYSEVKKRHILLRDNYTCAYCLKKGDTIDHIIPSSKGGKFTWKNCITSCKKCNNKKGNRTPQQAGMTLQFHAYQPSVGDMFRMKAKSLGLDKIDFN